MDPNSKPFAWLGVVASATGILGFLAQIGLAPIFDPLKTTVGLPLWLALILVALVFWGTAVVWDRATRRLLERIDKADEQLEAARRQNETVAGEPAQFKSRRENPEGGKRHADQLARYEALEQEILGLLASGAEMTLSEIVDHTSVSLQPDRRERVTRAIAALGDRIEGSGGAIARYRLSRARGHSA
jgi:membrane protein implicated in regulation of membrane protease activity